MDDLPPNSLRDALLGLWEAMQRLRLALVEAGLHGGAARRELNDSCADIIASQRMPCDGMDELTNMAKVWLGHAVRE